MLISCEQGKVTNPDCSSLIYRIRIEMLMLLRYVPRISKWIRCMTASDPLVPDSRRPKGGGGLGAGLELLRSPTDT